LLLQAGAELEASGWEHEAEEPPEAHAQLPLQLGQRRESQLPPTQLQQGPEAEAEEALPDENGTEQQDDEGLDEDAAAAAAAAMPADSMDEEELEGQEGQPESEDADDEFEEGASEEQPTGPPPGPRGVSAGQLPSCGGPAGALALKCCSCNCVFSVRASLRISQPPQPPASLPMSHRALLIFALAAGGYQSEGTHHLKGWTNFRPAEAEVPDMLVAEDE